MLQRQIKAARTAGIDMNEEITSLPLLLKLSYSKDGDIHSYVQVIIQKTEVRIKNLPQMKRKCARLIRAKNRLPYRGGSKGVARGSTAPCGPQ